MLLYSGTTGSGSRSQHVSSEIFLSKRTFELQHHIGSPQKKVGFVAVPITAVVLEKGKHRHMESIQAANSHILTPEEGWLRSHHASELLQMMGMKVL